MNNQLQLIQQEISLVLASTRSAGRIAFDDNDPDGAKQQAIRLELAVSAEFLIQELDSTLTKLGVGNLDLADEIINHQLQNESLERADTARTKDTGSHKVSRDLLAATVLKVLTDKGGHAHVSGIRFGVNELIGGDFTSTDRELRDSNQQPNWQYELQWCLTDLKNDGLIEKTGVSGCWRLKVSDSNGE